MKSLIPLFVFLASFFVAGLLLGDFYKMPVSVAFLVSCIVALGLCSGKLQERIDIFSSGAADKNVLLMIWIFIAAGAFAGMAKSVGAIDATVRFALFALPGQMLYLALFVAACFVSLSIGSSVGTIVALVPIASGLSSGIDASCATAVSAVVGGAFFGDNLSFISDTTIAATQTTGCRMSDKFKVNFRIVLPAALLTSLLYIYLGFGINTGGADHTISLSDVFKMLPYIAVIVLSVKGLNVLLVLAIGFALSLLVGLVDSPQDIFSHIAVAGEGITGMGELIIVTLLAAGMLAVMRSMGGMGYIISKLSSVVSGRKSAECAIASLVSVANLCTANNTIAIISVGGVSSDLASRFGVDKRKVASLLDIFSCTVQGIIPYGAQLLMASGLSGLHAMQIITGLAYTFLVGASALVSIFIGYPKFKA